jgi:heme-degrading monooxygenase HmoA
MALPHEQRRGTGAAAPAFSDRPVEDMRSTARRAQAGSPDMPQIRSDNQLVTQITFVEPEPGKQAEALALMTERAHFMARQPGFVAIALHRSLDGSRIVNYVQWQSRDLLAKAHKSPDFRKEWNRFDQLAEDIDPHLYEVACVEESGRA